jgi:hypothetical protein
VDGLAEGVSSSDVFVWGFVKEEVYVPTLPAENPHACNVKSPHFFRVGVWSA